MQVWQNEQPGFWEIIQNNGIFGHDVANIAYLTELCELCPKMAFLMNYNADNLPKDWAEAQRSLDSDNWLAAY
jgi:hypothetical protein